MKMNLSSNYNSPHGNKIITTIKAIITLIITVLIIMAQHSKLIGKVLRKPKSTEFIPKRDKVGASSMNNDIINYCCA